MRSQLKMPIKEIIVRYLPKYINNSIIQIKKDIITFLGDFYKNKRRRLLERSFFSEEYFQKIFPEKDEYVRNFKNCFYDNNPFNFAIETKRYCIKKKILEEFSEYQQSVISKANLILKNNYTILKKNHIFTTQVNWFYSFFNDFIWPFKRSKEIKWILNHDDDIDLKYTLRLNYHDEFITLGLAFFLTEDEKYSEKFIELILDWIKKNPPDWGVNWIDFLEVSHRVVCWIFALSFFKNSTYITNVHLKQISESLYQQVYFISINNNKKSYNHTIGEQFTIFLFSNFFKSTIKSLKKWNKKAEKVLLKQIKRQTQMDGVNIEQTTNYHRMILEIFSLFIIINPVIISSFNTKLIGKMFEFWLNLLKPDTTIPLVGDTDEAHFIPTIFFETEKNINLDLLHLGAALYNKPEYKLLPDNRSLPLILLLLGCEGLKRYNNIEIKQPDEIVRYFSQSGYLIGRSNWETDANYLFFDMGQFGPENSGHDHSDISNIIFCFEGKPVLIDSGTYMYNIQPHKRNSFRSSKAHNILTIDNQNQAKIISEWSWTHQPKIRRSFIREKSQFIGIIEHNGYQNFIIRRKIIANYDLNDIKIIETVIPLKIFKKNSIISIYFHFPTDINLEIRGNEIIIDNKLILKINRIIEHFEVYKSIYNYSPYYGIKKKGQLIEFRIKHHFSKLEDFQIFYHLYEK